jgi:hypothetical protein
MKTNEYVTCPICGKQVRLNIYGEVRLHFITKPVIIPGEFLPPEEHSSRIYGCKS